MLTWALWPEDTPMDGLCVCDEPARLPVFGAEHHQAYSDKRLAICGAGPSLKLAYREIRKADHVWGCNRACHYLNDWGWSLTHGVGIDAGTSMFESCWATVPTVRDEFILATSVHPRTVDHILEAGQRVRFFHSMRGGVEDEVELYRTFFEPAPIVGRGLNVVNRALELAMWLGYRHIWICGADNALAGDAFYADGSPKADHKTGAVYLRGKIHGRTWTTTTDMLMSAGDLARMKWEHGQKVEFVGNTLPAALARTSEAFIQRCARWATDDDAQPAAALAECT